MEHWPQQYVNAEVRRLVEVVKAQQAKIDSLVSEVERLKETKADRRGRKPTGGQSPG